MKFYDRQKEITELQKMFQQSGSSARMTVLTGRRRVGKTLLALEYASRHKFIYLFVSKKSEPLLCAEFLDEIKKHFDVPVIGDIKAFKDIFALLLEIAKKEHFTLIVDEFQEFQNVNPSVFSEIQHLWDLHKARCKLNLIFIGSVYSLMHKIFQESKEPLFGRSDRVLLIQPFRIGAIHQILSDYKAHDVQSLFDMYVLTGGMPKYLDLFIENEALSFRTMVDFMLDANSPFIHEGKNLLIEEFGRDYGTYFSILELIASGKTARSEIESLLESNVGGYLDRLEKDYAIVSKHKPVNAKPNSRLQKYKITDNFLNFWFRFIYRNRSAVETGNFSYVGDIIRRDYAVYCGRMLENFFRDLLADTGQFNQIGSYWERNNEKEIDIVAVNDLKKEITLTEVKLNKSKINMALLEKKAENLLQDYKGYKPVWLGLSLEDAKKYLP
ncbi:MAG: ATP-binding protein [Kiritimatiellae bacterium]|nr:ATP-binding protein [Kiritimatiellia bacterium]